MNFLLPDCVTLPSVTLHRMTFYSLQMIDSATPAGTQWADADEFKKFSFFFSAGWWAAVAAESCLMGLNMVHCWWWIIHLPITPTSFTFYFALPAQIALIFPSHAEALITRKGRYRFADRKERKGNCSWRILLMTQLNIGKCRRT